MLLQKLNESDKETENDKPPVESVLSCAEPRNDGFNIAFNITDITAQVFNFLFKFSDLVFERGIILLKRESIFLDSGNIRLK